MVRSPSTTRAIDRLDRGVFNRAVEVGDELEIREWAMFMILVARCLQRRAHDELVDAVGLQAGDVAQAQLLPAQVERGGEHQDQSRRPVWSQGSNMTYPVVVVAGVR